MPKVSVIIPFNNVENYIDECLNSVLNQTLDDIEVIMINDASTDATPAIVSKYAEKDSRIKVLNIEERKGQGFARNRGIEIATGEYIGFVDSDDFIEPDMFELLYNSAKNNDTDISMCQVREYDDINEKYITSDYYSLAPLSAFGENVFSAEDTKNSILDINVALWNKVYKREFLIEIGEKFPEGFIYEDLPFFFGTYLPAKRIQIVWKNLYSYRINRKNSTMQQFNNKILDRLPMVSLTYEKLKSVPYLSDLKQKIQGWIINDLFHRYSLLKENYHKEFFFLMKKVFQSLDIENLEDDYWKKVYHFQGYILVMNNSFEDFNNKVFTEYLDIHKVEDRLRSEMIDIEELDRRFNLIYEDLGKTYKYTEDLTSSVSNKINEISEEIHKVIDTVKNEFDTEISNKSEEIKNNTDVKISQVYDEITKNYKYTEELSKNADEKINNVDLKVNSLEGGLTESQKSLESKIEVSKLDLINETDSKISLVYDEITKNYKYTEELVQKQSDDIKNVENIVVSNKDLLEDYINTKTSELYNSLDKSNQAINAVLEEKTKHLYNDIKDLSFVLQDNFVELNKEQDKILEQNKQIISATFASQQKNEEKINNLRNEYKDFISSKMQDLSVVIKQVDTEVKDYLESIQNKLESEKQQNIQNAEDLKVQFTSLFELQQKKYDEELDSLKKQMIEMEQKLREEMKSPIKKFIEKYQNKSEK